MSLDKVKKIYDTLHDFESDKRETLSYPIHKKLNFPKEENIQDINDWIENKKLIPELAHILDAGCGTGYSLLYFCGQSSQRSGVGISVSPSEIHDGNQAAKEKYLENKCRFLVQDFTQLLPDNFDAILALESLKHAPDLNKALHNLSSHLKENGKIIIVEDFYVPNRVEENLQNKFLDYWSVPSLHTEKYYEELLQENDMQITATHDFTPYVFKKYKKMNLLKIQLLDKALDIMRSERKKVLSRIFNGGWIMDHFYNVGAFEYKMMVTEKIKRNA